MMIGLFETVRRVIVVEWNFARTVGVRFETRSRGKLPKQIQITVMCSNAGAYVVGVVHQLPLHLLGDVDERVARDAIDDLLPSGVGLAFGLFG